MKLGVKQFVEAEQVEVARVLIRQESRVLPSPRPAFPDQDLRGLFEGITGASVTAHGESLVAPAMELRLQTVEDGTFFVGHGLDGTILTAANQPVHQTAAFRGMAELGVASETMLDLPEPFQFDEVFVGFDGAWRNYFHWMCFGLTKSFLGAKHLGASVAIVVPDYDDALRDGAISYSRITWQQSLEFSGLSERVTLLPKGVYRARRVHFLWTTPRAPTDILYLDAFKEVYDRMIAHAIPTAKEFENIYLARSRSVSNRLGGSSADIPAAVLARRGFRTVGFEGADLQQQISIFASARRVVSPHGAGLTNTLFHPGGLRVLELNRALDGSTALRPWFYVTSAIRDHRYVSLDSAMAGFEEFHVDAAIDALDA